MDKNVLIQYCDMKEEIKDLRRRITETEKQDLEDCRRRNGKRHSKRRYGRNTAL